jgi:xanthine dehydrogenase large subunit
MTIVGKTIPYDSARGHVTGRADYIDDLPRFENELIVDVVGSPIAAAKLKSIELSLAKQVPGVVAVLTHKDIPGHKVFGPLQQDEPILAFDEVSYVGQPIVIIAATNESALRTAKSKVQFTLEPTTPIFTIDEAIAANRFIGVQRKIAQGDAAAAMLRSEKVLSGRFISGGQEQFYLESQAAIAIPGDDGQLTVHSSTQNTTEIQNVVAEVLGVGNHQVVAYCKRMGGAFGGKETQAALPAAYAALVAMHTRRPARIIYGKDQDMMITGKRHPYQTDWKVGFDRSGHITALHVDIYSNGGATADLSTSVLERTMMHIDNAYYLSDVEITGRVCRTNLPSNTAFRGFGGPQAIAIIENIIEEIAGELNVDSFDVRLKNLYGVDERNVTPYDQIYVRNHLNEILPTVAATSHYHQRRQSIASHSHDPLRLRGIAMTPIKFGISFTSKFLNQANALVNVYTDGTVQVSTGGTEMGQGLNTKIRQIVADEFGIDWNNVLLMPTSTEKNNNTSPTAASAGTDLNGAAAVDGCRQIRERLAELAARKFTSPERGLCEAPECVVFEDGHVFDNRSPRDKRMTFAELAKLARFERIDLGARGFYKTPGVDFNRDTGKGNPFLYFTQGAAVAEVEIDRFTGELTVTQLDLLTDIGESINPGIDRGQIIGGFVQGMGWVTAEALVYDNAGKLLSHSPTTYKIPAITDIPKNFRCDFFENSDNVQTVRRSKAVGEPPLMLGVCVWAAVKDALRRHSIKSAKVLTLPATGEEILRCIELSEQPARKSTLV